jgi:PAS domain S-box-containing protein
LGTRPLADLLAEWRAAERRWERPASASAVHAAALDVIRSWVAYQDAALPADSAEFMLVADDERRYVGVTRTVRTVLGYEPTELIGKRIEDLAHPEQAGGTSAEWQQFLEDGRRDGLYVLRAKDGRGISCSYQARAHHPAPGFHMSRLWVDPQSRAP